MKLVHLVYTAFMKSAIQCKTFKTNINLNIGFPYHKKEYKDMCWQLESNLGPLDPEANALAITPPGNLLNETHIMMISTPQANDMNKNNIELRRITYIIKKQLIPHGKVSFRRWQANISRKITQKINKLNTRLKTTRCRYAWQRSHHMRAKNTSVLLPDHSDI